MPPAAALALAEARAALAQPAGARAARERALAAARLAPDWVAPQRFLDDLALHFLRGPQRLAARRAASERAPADARAAYLAARLISRGHPAPGRGTDDLGGFRGVLARDPSFAWGWHGAAVTLAAAGERDEARHFEEEAIERAREPFDRAFFEQTLARFELAAGRRERALARLARWADPEQAGASLAPADRAALAARLVAFELADRDPAVRRRGFHRGLALVAGSDLAGEELERLALRLAASPPPEARDGAALLRALGSRPGRERLIALLGASVGLGDRRVALAWLEGAGERDDLEALPRPVWFAAGRGPEAMERWRAALVPAALTADGLPRRPALAGLVRAGRVHAERGTAKSAREFGDALLAAGWFEEAQAFAGTLAALDPPAAIDLVTRAAAGRELLTSLAWLVAGPEGIGVDARDDPQRPRTLGGVLEELAGAVRRAAPRLAPLGIDAALADELAASPRSGIPPLFELVDPGPWAGGGPVGNGGAHSSERRRPRDRAAAGLGAEPAQVPGLARFAARLGRFVLLGRVLGAGGPDGVVLRAVAVQRMHGELLGRPWSGTVVLAEGGELESRAERFGARISGAALHEGYWIDLGELRRERRALAALLRRFEHPDRGTPAEAVAAALGQTGLPLRGRSERERARERRALGPPLGEAARLRLAAMCAAGEGPKAVVPPLERLLEAVELHERAHLADRAWFLPLHEHPGRALGFLLETGFSPRRIQERLEYRAQLVALCTVSEPRLALAAVLDALEPAEDGPLPHGDAYRELARDLLAVLDRALGEDPRAFPSFDPGRTLLHQLHRATPEELRAVALRLAARRGLALHGAQGGTCADPASRAGGPPGVSATQAPVPWVSASTSSAAASSASSPSSVWSPMCPMRKVRPRNSP